MAPAMSTDDRTAGERAVCTGEAFTTFFGWTKTGAFPVDGTARRLRARDLRSADGDGRPG